MFLFACKKHIIEPKISVCYGVPDSLMLKSTKWELRTDSGGIYGIKHYNAGNGYIYNFRTKDSFDLTIPYSSVSPIYTGWYKLTSTSISNKYILQLEYNYDGTNKITKIDSVLFLNNYLYFIPIVTGADMPVQVFEKI